jgi:hypothetical protein
MGGMKRGEAEALRIMKSLGFLFDESFHDDGSEQNMPDLKFSDGCYLEVTHTKHNECAYLNGTDFDSHSIEEKYNKSKAVSDALERFFSCDYQMDENKHELTEIGKKLRLADAKLLKEYLGYDSTNGELCEFKCDVPVFTFESDNIFTAVRQKFEKYKKSKRKVENINVFIFAQYDELEALLSSLSKGNSLAKRCYMCFPRVFVCGWDLGNQKYDFIDPVVVQLYDSGKWEILSGRKRIRKKALFGVEILRG